jgi:phage gp45-like
MNNSFVPPSGLLSQISTSKISAFSKNMNNNSLRLGVIVKVHDIEDESNLSKVLPEYDVITTEQNKDMGQSFVTYTNCIAADSLGGIADFFEFKRRPSEKEDFKQTFDVNKHDGSMVLLLCLDGYTDKAIIISAITNVQRKTTLTKDNELHLEGEYNGLNWKVDKEGALTVTFRSATDSKGVPQDEQSGGTFVKMDKEGSIELNTNLKEKDVTSVKLDKAKKDITVTAGQSISQTAQKDIKMAAEGELSGSAKGSLSFVTEGAAKISAKSGLTLDGSSQVDIKGDTTKITGGNMVQIEGGKLMINTPKVFIGQGGLPAVIGTTKFVGIGNKGSPVVCNAIGPFSSSVFIAS